MSRVWPFLGLLAVLAGLVAATLEIETDARGLFGADDPLVATLDTARGRLLTLAILHPDRDRRSELAAEIAEELPRDPLVSRVVTEPGAPSAALIDWLWRFRLVLAPPGEAAFAPASMAEELRRARAALTSLSGGALAERYLLDPTGSFRRVIEAISAASATAPPQHRGIAQSADDTAALLFIALADRPFEVDAQSAFDARLRARVERAGAEALLVGPRSISARISARIAGRATGAAVIAGALVLLWLAVALRPARNLPLCLVPLGVGLGTAALAVTLAFGSVHVIALGFGGALMGLAMDYPIHLVAHRGRASDLARARRYVALCAATTGIAFLALLGSGISVLGQVGVFAASGLVGAAACAAGLIGVGAGPAPGPAPGPTWRVLRPIRAPAKHLALAAVGGLAAGVLWLAPGGAPQRLIGMPPEIVRSIERLDELLDLPSGRYRIEVRGATLGEVLDRQAALLGVLREAERAGTIGRFELLARYLPARPPQPALPEPEAISAPVAEALEAAGLAAGFREDILAAYRAARDAPAPEARTLAPLGELAAIAGLVSRDGGALRAPAQLWDVAHPDRLAAAVAALDAEGVVFVDEVAALSERLDALAHNAARWMAAGAGAGLVFLLLALRRRAAVAEIALGCVAAGLVTAAANAVATGGLGVLDIVALTLVIGIGIDYGLFLTLSESGRQYAAALRSVLVCATSTLIAFLTLALSGVTVLEDIGATVSVGVLAMLAVHILRRPAGATGSR